MLDVFFISWDEPDAQEHYNMLVKKTPHALWLTGVKGIHNAHIKCAKMSFTPNFYVVDADTIVKESFNFSYTPPEWDDHYTHIWRSKNPFNQLVYGHGGIKLFSKEKVLATEGKDMPLDYSMSVSDIKIMNEIASVTAFNSSPFHTWRGSFRECAKLGSSFDIESAERLEIWLDHYDKDVPYAKQYIKGAEQGAEFGFPYGFDHLDPNEFAKKINDFEWLKEQYDESI